MFWTWFAALILIVVALVTADTSVGAFRAFMRLDGRISDLLASACLLFVAAAAIAGVITLLA